MDDRQLEPEAPDELRLLAAVPVPAVFFTPETGFGGGIGIVHTYRHTNAAPDIPDSSFIPALIYTQRDQLIGRGLFEHYSQQGIYYWNATLAYTRYPDRFYGVGANTLLTQEELFTEVYGSAELSITGRIAPQTYLGPLARYEEFAVRDRSLTGILIRDELVGSNHGIIAGAGLRLFHNSRDNSFVPRSGKFVELSLVRHLSELNSTYNFTSSSGRVRKYWPVSSDVTIAFEVIAEDRGGQVPFRKLALLGGQYLLRGYFLGRYRDSKLTATQIDFRQMLGPKFGFVLFASNGWVGSEWDAFELEDVHLSYGGGLRFILDDASRINLRIDYGKGRDSSGVYMGVGEAF